MTEPVNAELRRHLDEIAASAARRGVNLWDELNLRGLLYTDARRRLERSAAVHQALDRLDALTPPQILGGAYARGTFTAGDMRRGIADRLYEIAADMLKGTI